MEMKKIEENREILKGGSINLWEPRIIFMIVILDSFGDLVVFYFKQSILTQRGY